MSDVASSLDPIIALLDAYPSLKFALAAGAAGWTLWKMVRADRERNTQNDSEHDEGRPGIVAIIDEKCGRIEWIEYKIDQVRLDIRDVLQIIRPGMIPRSADLPPPKDGR